MTLALYAVLACFGGDKPANDTSDTSEEPDADTDADADTDTDTDTDADADTDVRDLANGQLIHDQTCMNGYCHGSNDIIEQRSPNFTDEELYDVIDQGSGYMSPLDDLTDDDILDVIAYIRTIY